MPNPFKKQSATQGITKAQYMAQSMSGGVLSKITYYPKQKQPHVSHDESGGFTGAV